MKYFHAADGEDAYSDQLIDAMAGLISQTPETALEYLKGVDVVPECVRYPGLHEDHGPQPDAVNFPFCAIDDQADNINPIFEP